MSLLSPSLWAFCILTGPWHPIPPLSLFSAFLFILPYDSTITSSSIPFRGLPLTLFPSILPWLLSIILRPQHMSYPVFFLFLITLINCRFSPTLFKISSFVYLSIQLTLSILLHIHISTFTCGYFSLPLHPVGIGELRICPLQLWR